MNKKLLYPILAGALFALGLVVSGMTLPSKVVGFLDFTHDWDPSLAFVMVGAIGVHAAFRAFARRFHPSWIAEPERSAIVDWRLLGGAAVFGIGWALAGYCPGPAVVSLGSFTKVALAFVLPMLVGLAIGRALLSKKTAS